MRAGGAVGLVAVGVVLVGAARLVGRGAPAAAEEHPRATEDREDGKDGEDAERAAFERERGEWQRRESELGSRIARLEGDLADEQERRRAREQEWLEFTRAITSLAVPGTPAPPEFAAPPPEPEAPAAGGEERSRAAEEAAARRSAEVLRDLRALLLAEQVLALDVLEVGRVRDGFTGPVVVRLLDDYGRPAGTLAAERLRIEASRAGRSVTLVFEEGYESHGGVPVPFGTPEEPGSRRGGLRRIHLGRVDPEPWIEALPELVEARVLLDTPDDGLWNVPEVRMRVDELLRADPSGGHWRLRALGGVVGDELRDVEVVELDHESRVHRRLFADVLRVRGQGRGVELVLEDGVQERLGRVAPFLDGTFRIFLPRARAEGWTDAGIPGLPAEPRAPGR